MRIENDIKLDFCDVLIKPKKSPVPSRSEVDLIRNYNFLNSKNSWSGIPVIAANMDTTGTFAMTLSLSHCKMLTCLHKHYPTETLINFFQSFPNPEYVFYTLGIGERDLSKFERVYSACGEKIQNVCIDVANGYISCFVDFVKSFRNQYPSLNLMAGNIATPEMVLDLVSNGVDIIKVGIGSGAVCTTRKISGVGFPQFSAILETADVAHGCGAHVCSDGGCVDPGDVAKAFAAGADFVMLGGMLGGCEECEGDWNYDENLEKQSLVFYGMSSSEAMNKYNGGVACYRAAEGKSVEVPYKGPANVVVSEIMGGLVSACSYVGTKKLKDLSKCTTFIRVNRTHNTIFGN